MLKPIMIKRVAFSAAAIALMTILLLALFYFTLQKALKQPINLKEDTLITINNGETINSFSERIRDLGWIENRFWLRNYVRLYPELGQLKKGTYQIAAHLPLEQLLQLLVSGKEHQFTITFVEGTSIKQWLTLLANTENIRHELPKSLVEASDNEFSVSYVNNDKKMQALAEVAQQLKIEHINPEGYFYPDTYAFSSGDSDIDILKRAHKKMLQELDKRWQSRDQNLPYQTKHQALTMASIIEKESGKYAEHEIIASVFINRLNKKMRLQTDPTVIYGLGEQYFGDIKYKHLRDKTAYNTRKIKGLPPTPIAMPGKNALDAAFSPAITDYFYFVSNGKGEHIFSTNLQDHNRAVRKYQLKK